MNQKLLKGAIGNQEGDYLTLASQWAKVIVTLEGNGAAWMVSGDILDLRGAAPTFPTLAKAMDYAVESLKAYRDGSPNK